MRQITSLARRCCAAMAALALAIVAASASALESSALSLDIGQLVGAEVFYEQGFAGAQTIVASIEGGLVWNGHQSLNLVTKQLAHPSAEAEFDRHATWMGAVIAGRGGLTTLERGIAFDATLWTGAVASSWEPPSTPNGFSVNYERTPETFVDPFLKAMVDGVDGKLADVVSSVILDSRLGVQNGKDFYSLFMDAAVSANGRTWVTIAGGLGPEPNSIGSPASGMNGLVVGALRSESTTPPYREIVPASSRSPSDLWVPNIDGTGVNVEGARARVDITAPGANMSLPHYGGPTGSNQWGGPTDALTNAYDIDYMGAGAAAAVVAGGAALVIDAGKVFHSFNPNARDGRIVKAVLMNSASKPAGWDNGQADVAGVVTTTQSLDYVYGAGSLNLARAWPQYIAATADVPGLEGGAIAPVGWDYGRITHLPGQTAVRDYLISQPLTAGTTLTATVTWYSDVFLNLDEFQALYSDFDNLDLQVWLAPDGAPTTLVAESVSQYNSAEHLSFMLPEDGTYLIRVLEDEFVWNGFGETGTDFGLAWSVAAPAGADFDADGDVDGGDFLAWQSGVGIPSGALKSQGDADADGDVDASDVALWKAQFGTPPGALPSSTSAPEPNAIALALGAAACVIGTVRRLTRRGRFGRRIASCGD